jgi:hypothetical protein
MDDGVGVVSREGSTPTVQRGPAAMLEGPLLIQREYSEIPALVANYNLELPIRSISKFNIDIIRFESVSFLATSSHILSANSWAPIPQKI